MSDRHSEYEYKIGGSLDSNNRLYVKRECDRQLYAALEAGEFCYVLNCRQMGKSSLRVRTMKRLTAAGVACAEIDITSIGSTGVTVSQWYAGIVRSLAISFKLTAEFQVSSWLQQHSYLSPVQSFREFIDSVLLVRVKQKIVIFIDEIDSVLSLEFSLDDFFASIRGIYNKRADNSECDRLTFCLLGVAAPGDLVRDKRRTPFNIGRAIELNGFKFSEAQPLMLGWQGEIEHPQVLEEILFWTGGQPFLTQKLCKLIAEFRFNPDKSAISVERIVKAKIIEHWEGQDEPEHLKTIRDRILRNEQGAGRLLGLYQQILDRGSIAADGSKEQTDLRLSGLVVKQDGRLVVNNPIYKAIFNRDWLEQEFAKLRPYAETITTWIDSGGTDESRLLRGKALQDTLGWAADKNLSNLDYQFLNASQEVDKREANKALELKKESNARKTAQIRMTLAIILMAVAGIVAVATNKLRLKAERSQINAEQEELIASTKATEALLESDRQFEALLQGVRSGLKLQKADWRKDVPQIETDISDILQRAVYWIKESNSLQGQNNRLWDVNFSPNSLSSNGDKTIVSAGKNIQLWKQDGTLIRTITGHEGEVLSASFSPDGKTIASASKDHTVKLWKRDGTLIQTFTGHTSDVRDVVFSSDGKLIVSGSNDSTLKVWRRDGSLLQTLTGHNGEVLSVGLSPDRRIIASASNDKTVKLWSIEGELLQTLNGADAHEDEVWDVAFSPDGELIATASRDKTVKLWNTQGELLQTLIGHTDGVLSVGFSPDGKAIATAGYDKTVKLWRLDGQLIDSFTGHSSLITSVSFSPDGKAIATASFDNSTKLWNLDNRLKTLEGHSNWVFGVSFSPDGQLIATASRDATIRLWDRNGELLKTLNGTSGHKSAVWDVAFSPNGKAIATASNDNTVKLWNINGELLHTFNGQASHQAAVYGVAFSPDGKIIASASNDNTIKLWNINGELLHTFNGQATHQAAVWDVVFSPDGKLIASASSDNTVKLWNKEGKLLYTFNGHQDSVSSVSFSPDGKTIASASGDNTVKLWNKEGRLLNTLSGHRGSVGNVSFSPDGKIVATASNDTTTKLWNLDGQILHTINGYKGAVFDVDFSPDGKTIAFAGSDNTSILANLEYLANLDGLLIHGCNWLHDYLKTNPSVSQSDRHMCDGNK